MIKICKECGSEYKTDDKRRKFCSQECYNKYRKEHPESLKGVFKKGHSPWNKNLKGIHLSPASEFKKGQQGVNYLSVGSIIVRIDKNGKKRNHIKIDEPNKWIEYARFIWIQHYGEIPMGFVIHHIDEDTLNDNINNLALMTRRAHFMVHNIGEKGRAARAIKHPRNIAQSRRRASRPKG